MGILANIFLCILNISIMGTITAAFLLLVKWIFRNRLNPTWHYYIWIILVIRLVIPIFPESPFSLFNLTGMLQQELDEKGLTTSNLVISDSTLGSSAVIDDVNTPLSDNKTALSSKVNNDVSNGSDTGYNLSNANTSNDIDTHPYNHTNATPYASTAQKSRPNNAIYLLSIIWLSGVIGFLAYTCVCNIHINRMIKKCPVFTNTANTRMLNIFNACKAYLSINSTVNSFGSPCLYGLIKPKLLIPSILMENIDERHIRYIFLHELMHLKRKDLYLNAVLIVLKAVYWFNPLFWYCFSIMHSDCEVSCDESVMLRLENKEWIEYGKTILEASGYCSGLKPSYFVVGVTNKKSNTEKRILKAINFKRPSFLLTSLAVVVTLILGFVLLTDGVINPSQTAITENETAIVENSPNDPETGIDENANTVADNDAEKKLSDAFEKLCLHILAGYSQEATKQKLSDEYNYIIAADERAVEFLKAQIANITGKLNHRPGEDSDNEEPLSIRQEMVRRKTTAEWLISDIFKKRGGEEYKPYKNEYPVTVLKRDCIGRTGPGDGFDQWCVIPENTIVQLTGNLGVEWWTAKRVEPLTLPEDESGAGDAYTYSMHLDGVEFWINIQDFEFDHTLDKPLYINSTNINDALEYTWVIQTGKKSERLFNPDNYIEIFDFPATDGVVVGHAFNNDLVRLKKDDEKNIIRHGEWVLIEKIPFYGYNSSNVGWVKEEYVVELTKGIQPLQGFILGDTLIYTEPDENSETLNDTYPGLENLLKYNLIACIHITDTKGDWLQVSAGVNSFTGWIQKDKIFYRITDEIINKAYHPEPDLDKFVSKLQEEILNNPSFIIKAEDTGDVFKPTAQQRNALASSLKRVFEPVTWDGSVMDCREAAYPFYRLEFERNNVAQYDTANENEARYSMVITTQNSLLLLMDGDICYDYGIGRAGPPIRLITPNIEFIQKIKELFPTKPNNSKSNINYLLNAKKLRFKGDYFEEAYTEQVHINKCVRAIRNAMGQEIPRDKIAENINGLNSDGIDNGGDNKRKTYLFEFKFDDGSIIVVTYTDDYIEYNGKYYQPLKPPHQLILELFIAYF